MRLIFAYITHGTGDGMPPFVILRHTLEDIKACAISALQPDFPGPCDQCGERAARGQERPEDECECECHEELEDYERLVEEYGPDIAAIENWNGEEELTVNYFDGNPGYLTLTRAQLPDA